MAYDRRRGSTPKANSDVSHDREFHQTSFDNQSDDVFSSGYHEGTGTTISSFGTYGEDKSTGMESIQINHGRVHFTCIEAVDQVRE